MLHGEVTAANPYMFVILDFLCRTIKKSAFVKIEAQISSEEFQSMI